MIFLDTNIVSYVMRAHPLRVADRFDVELSRGALCVSTIVYSELRYGAAIAPTELLRQKTERDIEQVVRFVPIIEWDIGAAVALANVRAQLKRAGTPVGPYDMAIAAHALSRDATLVTNNAREFRRIPGLKVENWA